jgi:hypothetical protein
MRKVSLIFCASLIALSASSQQLVNLSKYGPTCGSHSLNNIINAVGNRHVVIIADCGTFIAVTNNVTIPQNVHLVLPDGAGFGISPATTLSFGGGGFYAPDRTIFTGSGTVSGTIDAINEFHDTWKSFYSGTYTLTGGRFNDTNFWHTPQNKIQSNHLAAASVGKSEIVTNVIDRSHVEVADAKGKRGGVMPYWVATRGGPNVPALVSEGWSPWPSASNLVAYTVDTMQEYLGSNAPYTGYHTLIVDANLAGHDNSAHHIKLFVGTSNNSPYNIVLDEVHINATTTNVDANSAMFPLSISNTFDYWVQQSSGAGDVDMLNLGISAKGWF